MSSLEKSLTVGIGILGMLVICCLGAIFGATVANNQRDSGQTAVTQQNRSIDPIRQEVVSTAPVPTAPTIVADEPTAVPTIPTPDLGEVNPNGANFKALSDLYDANRADFRRWIAGG